eukprot:COSAG02_NODE_52681_length_306_cov_0.917874_1_plen_45_part_01
MRILFRGPFRRQWFSHGVSTFLLMSLEEFSEHDDTAFTSCTRTST